MNFLTLSLCVHLYRIEFNHREQSPARQDLYLERPSNFQESHSPSCTVHISEIGDSKRDSDDGHIIHRCLAYDGYCDAGGGGNYDSGCSVTDASDENGSSEIRSSGELENARRKGRHTQR